MEYCSDKLYYKAMEYLHEVCDIPLPKGASLQKPDLKEETMKKLNRKLTNA